MSENKYLREPDFSKPVDVYAFLYISINITGINLENENKQITSIINVLKELLLWFKNKKNIETIPRYKEIGIFFILLGILEKNKLVDFFVNNEPVYIITEKGNSFLNALIKFDFDRDYGLIKDRVAYDGKIYVL